jgi:hypothetical protein
MQLLPKIALPMAALLATAFFAGVPPVEAAATAKWSGNGKDLYEKCAPPDTSIAHACGEYLVAIIRFNHRDGFVLIPSSVAGDGQWHEMDGTVLERDVYNASPPLRRHTTGKPGSMPPNVR